MKILTSTVYSSPAMLEKFSRVVSKMEDQESHEELSTHGWFGKQVEQGIDSSQNGTRREEKCQDDDSGGSDIGSVLTSSPDD